MATEDLLALANSAAVLVQLQRRLGAVLVETRRDVQLAVAPVDEPEAARPAPVRAPRGALSSKGA